MSDTALHLSRHLVNQLLRHAQQFPTRRVGGLIAASSPLALHYHPFPNGGGTDGLQPVLEAIRDSHQEPAALFQSCPDGWPAQGQDEGAVTGLADLPRLLLSLGTKGVLELRGFQTGTDGAVREIGLTLG